MAARRFYFDAARLAVLVDHHSQDDQALLSQTP
jgi:hypothetical protein